MTQLSYFDASNAHIVGDNQTVTLNTSSTIKMINNMLENVTFDIQDCYILDLTNTSAQGKIIFNSSSSAKRLFLADTNLDIDWQQTPSSLSFLDAVNANIDVDVDVLLQKLNNSNIQLINLQGNRITGLAPTPQQIQDVKQNSLIEYINLGMNPFICNIDGNNMYECSLLEPYQVEWEISKIWAYCKLSERVKQPSHLPQLQMFVKDENKSTLIKTEIVEAQNCSQDIYSYQVKITCDSQIFTDNASHVAIAINNMSVSTGSILVNQMIDTMLNRTTPDYSFKNLRVQSQKIKMQQKQQTQIVKTQQDPKILIQITAYSQCPDFINIQNYVFTPFSIKYPELLGRINYTYVSMATYNTQYKGFNATSLHGEYEAYKDLQYICLQDINKDYLIPTINCDVQGGKKCFENNIEDGDVKQEVRFCMQQKLGKKLLQRDSQTVVELNSLGSPTVYADGQMICSWNYYVLNQPTELDCAANYFGDADEFAKWLCNQPQMNGVQECQNNQSLIDLSNKQLTNEKILQMINKQTFDLVETLKLQQNQIKNLKFLKSFPNLIQLDISCNYIQDLSGIEQCKNIQQLNISQNLIKSLTPLKNLTKLQNIQLYCNQIDDINELINNINTNIIKLDTINLQPKINYNQHQNSFMNSSQVQNKLQQIFPQTQINGWLYQLPQNIIDIYKNENQLHIKNQDFEYEGQCLYLLPNGKGYIEADFILGYPTGTVFLKTDNYIYQGQLKDWKMQGKGILKCKEFYYEGDFLDGQMTGQGKILFEDGSLYQGDVLNGKRQGNGYLIDTDGSKYEGQWENDVAQGQGQFIDSEGRITVGIWKDNQLLQ